MYTPYLDPDSNKLTTRIFLIQFDNYVNKKSLNKIILDVIMVCGFIFFNSSKINKLSYESVLKFTYVERSYPKVSSQVHLHIKWMGYTGEWVCREGRRAQASQSHQVV